MNEMQRAVLTALLEADVSPEDLSEIAAAIAGKGEATKTAGSESVSESELCGDFIPLVEKAVRKDGTIQVKVIQPGLGSSGYYPPEVLERDGPRVFAKGLKMFCDHQTMSEEAERPEGSIRNLMGELISDARWEAKAPAGPGLYADAQVFDAWKPLVEELAPHIGVSIRASGRAKSGEVEGKRVPIIEELVSAKSVDFVTMPGAGGQIMTLFEAARSRAQNVTVGGEVDVDEKQLQEAVAAREAAETKLNEATDKVTALEAEKTTLSEKVARLEEGEILREAKAYVAETLSSELPEMTKQRLVETLSKNPPVKDGALDKESFSEAIEKAQTEEIKYLVAMSESGRIKGMGSSGETDTTTTDREALVESFERTGMTHEQAVIAAQGR
ncbi:MAG: hypothetical protein JW990_07700 [Thermoleophilia bacterium]|nr:hypothetical protein [Thermoleophilia bacterium]